jgi:dihydrofolate synthase/folylpolyglutamate synthase
MHAKCYPVSKKDYKINEIKKKCIDFSVTNLYDSYVSLLINTTALYQAENASIAYRTCEVLKRDCGLDKITDKSLSQGIFDMYWMGRMEEVMPDVYIDGAHNEDGIEAFANSLEAKEALDVFDKCVVVFSVVKDKEYGKMIKTLSGLLPVTDFIITHIPGARGADLEELKALFDKYCGGRKNIYTYDDIEDAIRKSMVLKGGKGRVYIVGSLYLAGIVENIFRRQA